ncbi:MAG: hypothetical protein HGB03_00545 [Candidatus Yonathbacteria bacterium]|nr:hypothetical protein [Candidatus Yonathbacteria bacterium]
MTKTRCPLLRVFEKPDHHPSFVVFFPQKSKRDQTFRWKCYGCGRHGTIIDYYMMRKKVSFLQAVIALAKYRGIPLEWKNIPHTGH